LSKLRKFVDSKCQNATLLPALKTRLAARQSEQCSGDLRDGRQQSTACLSRYGAANKPHDQPAALSLSAMVSQYFIGGMMAELANPVQHSATIIEIRPFRGGWQCFEAPGVEPYWTGRNAKQSAIGYATARRNLDAERQRAYSACPRSAEQRLG